MRATISNEELEHWAKTRADDAGALARELIVCRSCIKQIHQSILEYRQPKPVRPPLRDVKEGEVPNIK